VSVDAFQLDNRLMFDFSDIDLFYLYLSPIFGYLFNRCIGAEMSTHQIGSTHQIWSTYQIGSTHQHR